MLARVIIIGLGLAALACTKENPAFNSDRGNELADESGDGDPSGPEESGESIGGDGDGDGDGDPSESSSDGTEETTTEGDCTLGVGCGPCQVCEQGECVIDVGGPCEGPATHCAEYLYGESGNVCYKLTDVVLGGRCSEQGVCEPSPASDCPYQQGAVHFACDAACVTNPGGCPKYVEASEIEQSAMCVVDGGPGPECTSKCANGIESVVEIHGCVVGECTPTGAVQYCEGYVCDEQGLACLDSCETEAQCADQYFCTGSQCVPG